MLYIPGAHVSVGTVSMVFSDLSVTCRSLVATNDHLLQELEVAKQRHSQEVNQMNHNFEQLRKTMQLYT